MPNKLIFGHGTRICHEDYNPPTTLQWRFTVVEGYIFVWKIDSITVLLSKKDVLGYRYKSQL